MLFRKFQVGIYTQERPFKGRHLLLVVCRYPSPTGSVSTSDWNQSEPTSRIISSPSATQFPWNIILHNDSTRLLESRYIQEGRKYFLCIVFDFFFSIRLGPAPPDWPSLILQRGNCSSYLLLTSNEWFKDMLRAYSRYAVYHNLLNFPLKYARS